VCDIGSSVIVIGSCALLEMAAKMKRKKRVTKDCANPLFVKWVEELKDNAKEKGLQSQYTFTKVKKLTLSVSTLLVR